MAKKKISVAVITYNQEKYIRQCLESILAQRTEAEVEILLADDSSTDNTILEAEKSIRDANPHHFAVRILRRGKNLGVAGNWVATLEECDGDYIAVCEGDDYWVNEYKLQRQFEWLEKNPGFSVSMHNARCLDESGAFVSSYVDKGMPSEISFNDGLRGSSLPTPSLFFRNGLLNGNHWEKLRTAPVLDWIILLMLMQHGKIHYVNEDHAVYRVHANGFWSRSDKLQANERLLQIYSFICTIFPLNDEQKEIVRKSKAGIYRSTMATKVNAGNFLVFKDLMLAMKYDKPKTFSGIRALLAALVPDSVKKALKRR